MAGKAFGVPGRAAGPIGGSPVGQAFRVPALRGGASYGAPAFRVLALRGARAKVRRAHRAGATAARAVWCAGGPVTLSPIPDKLRVARVGLPLYICGTIGSGGNERVNRTKHKYVE